jgi:hypothetical protein
MSEEPKPDKRINIRDVDRSNIIISDRDVLFINNPLTTPTTIDQKSALSLRLKLNMLQLKHYLKIKGNVLCRDKAPVVGICWERFPQLMGVNTP